MDTWMIRGYEVERLKVINFSKKLTEKYNLKTCHLGFFEKKDYTIIMSDGVEQLPPFEFTCNDLLTTLCKWNSSNSRFSTVTQSSKNSLLNSMQRNTLPDIGEYIDLHLQEVDETDYSPLTEKYQSSIATARTTRNTSSSGRNTRTRKDPSISDSLKLLKHEDLFIVIDEIKDVGLAYIDFCREYEKLKIYVSMYQFFRIKQATDLMLDCLKTIPMVDKGMDTLLQYILNHAKILTSADRCSVWLKEKGHLRAIVFDGMAIANSGKNSTASKGPSSNKYDKLATLPIGEGIAGRVAKTGEIYATKSPDLESDEYFRGSGFRKWFRTPCPCVCGKPISTKNPFPCSNTFDQSTGYITKSILCFPIKSSDNEIVGVGQLCNKKKGSCFSKFDEMLAVRFVELCGSTIQHVSI